MSVLLGLVMAILAFFACKAHAEGNDGATDFLGILIFFGIVLMCFIGFSAPRSRRTRVLYLTQEDLAKHIAYASRIRYIARGLSEGGAHVEIVGFASMRPESSAHGIVSGTGWFARLRVILRVLAKVALLQADAVVITSIGSFYHGFLALLYRILGARVIYDCHDPTVETIALLAESTTLRPLLLRWIAFMDWIAHRVAYITIVPGAGVREAMRRRGCNGSYTIVYNVHGLAREGERSAVRPRERAGWERSTIVVYVGGLQPRLRGIETQVSAVAAARAAGADVRLLLVGFGDLAYWEPSLEPLLRDDAALLFDSIPQNHVEELLSFCDLAISSEPILFGAQSKFFESLYCGVRVIARDDGRDITNLFPGAVARYSTFDELVATIGKTGRLTDEEARSVREEIEDYARESLRALKTCALLLNRSLSTRDPLLETKAKT